MSSTSGGPPKRRTPKRTERILTTYDWPKQSLHSTETVGQFAELSDSARLETEDSLGRGGEKLTAALSYGAVTACVRMRRISSDRWAVFFQREVILDC